MSEELKPCPYCGETPKRPRDFFGTDGENLWGVSCENANCHVDIGVWHEDENEAIRMWNALPRPQRWTKKPPTEPGVYWLRKDGAVEVVKVYRERGELFVLYHGSDEDWDMPEGEWAGPIQDPIFP